MKYSLNSTTNVDGVNAGLSAALMKFEQAWQTQTWGEALGESYAAPTPGELQRTIARVVGDWPDAFGM